MFSCYTHAITTYTVNILNFSFSEIVDMFCALLIFTWQLEKQFFSLWIRYMVCMFQSLPTTTYNVENRSIGHSTSAYPTKVVSITLASWYWNLLIHHGFAVVVFINDQEVYIHYNNKIDWLLWYTMFLLVLDCQCILLSIRYW